MCTYMGVIILFTAFGNHPLLITGDLGAFFSNTLLVLQMDKKCTRYSAFFPVHFFFEVHFFRARAFFSFKPLQQHRGGITTMHIELMAQYNVWSLDCCVTVRTSRLPSPIISLKPSRSTCPQLYSKFILQRLPHLGWNA